jgi:hypothetical protein
MLSRHTALVILRYALWIIPPVIMCGSWQYGSIGEWLILVYWVVAVINLHYQLGEDTTETNRQQMTIALTICAQALGTFWSFYGSNLTPMGDFAWFGPVPAGIGATAGAVIILVGCGIVALYSRLTPRITL